MYPSTKPLSIQSKTKDPEGIYIILELSIMNLITIYAPNSDDSVWSSNLLEKVQKIRNNCEIWAGDLNVPLSENDIYNYPKLGNPKSSKLIKDTIFKSGLIHIWRSQNIDRKHLLA